MIEEDGKTNVMLVPDSDNSGKTLSETLGTSSGPSDAQTDGKSQTLQNNLSKETKRQSNRKTDNYREKNREVQKRYRERCREKSEGLKTTLINTENEINALQQENKQLQNEMHAWGLLQNYANGVINSIRQLFPWPTAEDARLDRTLFQHFQDAANKLWDRCITPSDECLRALLSNNDVVTFIEANVGLIMPRLKNLIHTWMITDDPAEKQAIEKRLKVALETRMRSISILLDINPQFAVKMYKKGATSDGVCTALKELLWKQQQEEPRFALTPKQKSALNVLWSLYLHKYHHAKSHLDKGLYILEQHTPKKNESCFTSIQNTASSSLAIHEAARLIETYQELEAKARIELMVQTTHIISPIQQAQIFLLSHPHKPDIVYLYENVFLEGPQLTTEATSSHHDAGHVLMA